MSSSDQFLSTPDSPKPPKPARARGVSRRNLLIGAGATAAGLGVAGYAGSRTPTVNFASASHGTTGPRLLVAYDSQYGSTGEIAQRIGTQLGSVARVDVRPTWEIDSLDGYRAMVFGAPVQQDRMKSSATDWLSSRSAEINRIPHAFFMPSASFGIDPDRVGQEAAKRQLLEQAAELSGTAPLSVLPMGGVVDFSKMAYLSGLVYQVASGNSVQGDFRDFGAVTDWVNQVQPGLLG